MIFNKSKDHPLRKHRDEWTTTPKSEG